MKILLLALLLVSSSVWAQTISTNYTANATGTIEVGAAPNRRTSGISISGTGTYTIALTSCRAGAGSTLSPAASTFVYNGATPTALAITSTCTQAAPCAFVNLPPCVAYLLSITACTNCNIDIKASSFD